MESIDPRRVFSGRNPFTITHRTAGEKPIMASMLQRIMAAHALDPSAPLSTLLANEMQSKFAGVIPTDSVQRLVADVFPLVPDNVETEFSLKTLEIHAERCGLDLTVKGIKSRNPPGDKSWKDAQRQLYDETLASSLFLKVKGGRRPLTAAQPPGRSPEAYRIRALLTHAPFPSPTRPILSRSPPPSPAPSPSPFA